MNEFSLLIGGKLMRGAATLEVINPATEEILATAPRADHVQLDQAVAAAKAAFPAWAATPLRERAALLVKLADALQTRHGEFARLLTEEQGKPLPNAMGEIARAVGMIRYFASLDLPLKLLKEDATQKVVQQRTPLGVVAAITPWNFPMILLMIKVAPALLAGNTVVAKPAPTTPLTTLRFGELCAEILPAGVVNIIVDQNDLGGALTSHPDVAKVAFTGSTATGKKVMESVAGTLKRLTPELGGNDPAIVLDDVDPKEIAPKVLAGATVNAGQLCMAIKRLYVHDSQYEEICEELGRLAREIVVNDGLKQGTQMGPLQNKAHFEKVKGSMTQSGMARSWRVARRLTVRAISSRRRSCVTFRTMRGLSGRSSSLRCCRCYATPKSMTPSPAPMIRIMGSEAAYGRRISTGRSTWRRRSIPARCGSISTSICRPIFLSLAPNNPAWARKWVRKDWSSSRR